MKAKYGEHGLSVVFIIAAVIGVQLPFLGSDSVQQDRDMNAISIGSEGTDRTDGADGANGGNGIGNNGEDGIGRDGTDGNANGADGADGEDGDVRGILISREP